MEFKTLGATWGVRGHSKWARVQGLGQGHKSKWLKIGITGAVICMIEFIKKAAYTLRVFHHQNLTFFRPSIC